jgi:5-phospho-D-xylono-1,4-lactonase
VTAVVRTVLGDIAPGELGVTYAHEHVILDSPLAEDRFADIRLHDVDAAVAELRTCAAAGVRTMVDAMPCAAGRDPVRLAAVSRQSGVSLVAATGLHTERWYPGLSWANEAGPDVLADLFTADVVEGVDRFDYRGPVVERTAHRAGVVKIGWLEETPSARDRRVYEAAAETHRRTGVPVLTHCEGGRGGLAQVELLTGYGVAADRIVLSHTDKVADPGYHRELFATGVYLEYDQALRQAPDEERGTAWLTTEMLGAGHGDRLMLGTDGARRSMWASLGGAPGLVWLVTGFTDLLRIRGVTPTQIDAMLVANPARFFPFEPPETA